MCRLLKKIDQVLPRRRQATQLSWLGPAVAHALSTCGQVPTGLATRDQSQDGAFQDFR